MLTTHTDKHVKIVTNYRNKTMINGRLCARKIMFSFSIDVKKEATNDYGISSDLRERKRERERGGGSRCKEKKVVCRRERNEKK